MELDTVQDPLLSDTVLSSPIGHLTHHYPGSSAGWAQVTTSTDDQLSEITAGGSTVTTDKHTAYIWNTTSVISLHLFILYKHTSEQFWFEISMGSFFL